MTRRSLSHHLTQTLERRGRKELTEAVQRAPGRRGGEEEEEEAWCDICPPHPAGS